MRPAESAQRQSQVRLDQLGLLGPPDHKALRERQVRQAQGQYGGEEAFSSTLGMSFEEQSVPFAARQIRAATFKKPLKISLRYKAISLQQSPTATCIRTLPGLKLDPSPNPA